MTATEARARYWSLLGSSSRAFDRILKEVIVEVDAIDTGWMKNTSVIRMEEKEERHVFKINTTFYFRFVDRGTSRITPREIIKKFEKRPETKEQIRKVLEAYWLWQALDPLTQYKLTAYL
jgi:hypothetical protein